jgi:hypothetical protein
MGELLESIIFRMQGHDNAGDQRMFDQRSDAVFKKRFGPD